MKKKIVSPYIISSVNLDPGKMHSGFGQRIDKHCGPFKTSCFGSIGMNLMKSESYYKGTILQRNYRKMTISWSLFYNFFVKFHGKNI